MKSFGWSHCNVPSRSSIQHSGSQAYEVVPPPRGKLSMYSSSKSPAPSFSPFSNGPIAMWGTISRLTPCPTIPSGPKGMFRSEIGSPRNASTKFPIQRNSATSAGNVSAEFTTKCSHLRELDSFLPALQAGFSSYGRRSSRSRRSR